MNSDDSRFNIGYLNTGLIFCIVFVYVINFYEALLRAVNA